MAAGGDVESGTVFRFTGGQPVTDAELSGDMRSLNAFAADQLRELNDSIFEFMTSPMKTNLIDLVERFAATHGVNLKALKNVCRACLVVFKGFLKHNASPAHVREDLTNLGVDAAAADVIVERWTANWAELSRSVTTNTLMVNKLVDIQWKFGVTTATDEMRQVGATYLQLRLAIDKGGSQEHVHMEMTLPQFYQFLADMERAKTFMDYLASA